MGYEISYTYHPRKSDGGYDTTITENKTIKVGKPFDDTSIEKCAAAIMVQLARRDVWVLPDNFKVSEFVKNEISFKESNDGKGIILKNKKYALGSTAETLAEDLVEVFEENQNLQPHEIIKHKSNSLDELYDANARTVIRKVSSNISNRNINQNKILYHVIYDPPIRTPESERKKLKFTEDKKYPVHAVIPKQTIDGKHRLDAQEIAVTDDTGKVVVLDEKYFVVAGKGLVGEDLGFSNPREFKPKLMHDNSFIDEHSHMDLPLDDGSIPNDLYQVPDIRKKR